jgi:hemoglobin-like flavoprotein
MTPREIELVQSSFAQVLPIKAAAATLFYDRLFTLDPALRPLFKGDMTGQGVKLMAVLATVVAALDDLSPLLDTVDQLAWRHVGYGVRPEHYATVGEALLWTLSQGLGPAFTPAVEAAWRRAYTVLSGRMLAAAAEPALAA